jgi:ATP-dependent helicase/nuclease subunit B
MAAHLYLAPAGQGKTAYVLQRIQHTRAADPLAPMRVILPNQAQVSAFRQRLAKDGGALGVSVGTFYNLYPEVLAWAGKPEPRLPEAAQYRLLGSIVARLADADRLPYYAPLCDKPGFIVALRALLEELKRAGIRRDEFRQAIQSLPNPEARLIELAEVYDAYQDWLLDNQWADTEGQGWLAALALERQPDLGRHLRLLVVDGFDEFNPTQLDVLKLLAGRAAETIITLVGTPQGPARLALRRFTRELQALGQALDLEPEPLPHASPPPSAPVLAHLEAHVFEVDGQPMPVGEALDLAELQNRAEEARAALRWLKARLIRDHMAPDEVALLARDLAPYRPFIEEIGAEFGLTLHLRQGLNLASNPAIAALLSLLALPIEDGGGPWGRRPVIDAWRSPYFEGLVPGMSMRTAHQLEAAARHGLVLRGLDQWRQALAQAARLAAATPPDPADEDLIPPPDHLTPAEALALQSTFEAFVARISLPPQETMQAYAALVEDLVGDDPRLAASFSGAETSTRPGVVRQAWAVGATAPRDVAALGAFKDVLRGLILAESFLGEPQALPYRQFYRELRSAVQGATYYLPPPEPSGSAVPVLSVLNARGLSFRAVALIGLAEGEFPRPEREELLLGESQRHALRQAGLSALAPRLRGDEVTFFYQALTRAREKLFVCRPYLAEDGQAWEASPYWKEVCRLVDAPVEHIRPEDHLPLSQVASPQELAQELARRDPAAFEPPAHLPATDLRHVLHSAAVLRARLADQPHSPFEGDLTRLSEQLSANYGPDQIWSSSRLEAYGLCPLHFWLGQDLALEPHQPPQEGFDVFILGSMYHEILEEVYRQAGVETDADRLLELLPVIAQQVFDTAPQAYGFRPTPLWEIQQRELEHILAQTLTALAEAMVGNVPLAQEQVFGMRGQPPLVIRRGNDELRLRGFIDRVDRDPDGRLCIIDYKSGSTPIQGRDLAEGRRLQIALYALAARDALDLGEVGDGFYWHIGSAKASQLKLADYEGGVAGALETASAHAFEHIAEIRAGHFSPSPPAAGCPAHCPGVGFCWQYKAKAW